MADLSDHVVVVTGATAGFGEATARRFAREGARVVAVGRRTERLEALAKSVGDNAVHPLTLDITDRAAVESAFAQLPAPFDEVTILVNNAGLALGLEAAHEADLADWQTMIETNCNAVTYCTWALLPGMVQREHGHVINIGSVAGSYPYPGGNIYGATKAFVHQFSLNLRADLLGTGVRVTCVEPGLAKTEFSLVRFKGDEAKAEKPYRGVEYLTADDIADVIHFVATMPAHVNVNTIELMPTQQAFGAFAFDRR